MSITEGMRFPVCPQCNTAHPALKPGEICPMAPQKLEKTGEVIDWNLLFNPLKTNIEIQIKMKDWDIKKINSVFKQVIVKVVQEIEKM